MNLIKILDLASVLKKIQWIESQAKHHREEVSNKIQNKDPLA
jgi:hypothetical protein